MGAERWLLFKSTKEANRAMVFLAPLGNNPVVKDDGCFLEWTNPRKLEVGYPEGGDGEIVTDFFCREVARRFEITRISTDSVGWYTDKDWQGTDPKGAPARYGPYTSWATWMQDYKPEWDWRCRVENDDLPGVMAIEAAVVSMFQHLDKGPPCP